MSNFCLDNLLLVVLYPLWVALLIFVGRFFAVNMSKQLVSWLTVLGSFAGVLFSLGSIPAVFTSEILPTSVFTFIKINDFVLNVGIAPDKLSIVFLGLLYIVSLFVQIFSISYIAYRSVFCNSKSANSLL